MRIYQKSLFVLLVACCCLMATATAHAHAPVSSRVFCKVFTPTSAMRLAVEDMDKLPVDVSDAAEYKFQFHMDKNIKDSSFSYKIKGRRVQLYTSYEM